jgi:curved DNA-binding protein CbpA
VKNYYCILDIEPSASQKEIREAYRKLAFQYHPDKNLGNPSANEKMQEINEAYVILSNPSKRKYYDLPLGYNQEPPKFKKGSRVKVNYHSRTMYRDHIGIVDKEPVRDTFRYWYDVKFVSGSIANVGHFAEEELGDIN